MTHDTGSSWTVLKMLASGPFSDVYMVKDDKGKRYAMKCEKEGEEIRRALKLDVMVLKTVLGRNGFPRFMAAGRTDYYKYCVMQLVGPDLGKLRRSLPDRKFSPATALNVLQQTLHRLESLHDAGWLCRDVKAPNFAIGLGQEEGTIYMLDFGFARKYRDPSGKILPPREKVALMGTFQYAPLSSHENKEQGRKDDLESWLYMAFELLTGTLPWANFDNHELMAEYKRSLRRKERATFFRELPPEFDHIMTMLDGYSYWDRPDYDKLQGLLVHAAQHLDASLKDPLDWQKNKRLLRKAEHVGELGESHLASAKLEQEEFELDITPPPERGIIEIDITPPFESM